MVLRRMHSHIFIGLLRQILGTSRLDENKQDQQEKLYPVPYHALFLILGSRQRPYTAVSFSSILAGQWAKRKDGMRHTSRLTMIYLLVPVLFLLFMTLPF